MDKIKSVFKGNTYYRPFLTAVLFAGLAGGLHKAILDNFVARVVGMNEMDRGVMEFFREMPGVALILILAALYMLSAENMYKLGAVIMLGGLTMLSILPPTMFLATASIFVYSLGEHIQLGMRSTISLSYSRENKGGEALGVQNAVMEIGSLTAFLIVTVVFLFFDSERTFKCIFFAAAALMAISMVFAFMTRGESATDEKKRRFYFRKKYKKYYMLEVFYGARKQVFMTFGPYVLIMHYGASTSTISLLFLISAVACFFASPLVGRIIDRMGYRIVMISDTLILVIVCFFYGFAHHLFPENVAFIICCANYVLDSVISLASMASNVYVQDLSDNEDEVKKTISTGVSVNHVISVLIALFGGWIWTTLGIEALFIVSAVLGLCNSAYAASIPKKVKTA